MLAQRALLAAHFHDISLIQTTGGMSWQEAIWADAAYSGEKQEELKLLLDIKWGIGDMATMLRSFFGVKQAFHFASEKIDEEEDEDDTEEDDTLRTMKKLEKKFNA